MATAALRRAMTAFTRPTDPTDADLLRQFAGSRCEAAFTSLVRRHGPLVLGVCRRVVPDRHLADDAFQAAFVVLARRAGGIDPTRPLGPWLYGVAHRVALRARTMLGKRRKRETLTAAVPDLPKAAPVVDDASAVLDEAIASLPPASREAVILCELQGLSRREAAARLGIAEGTLSSRLAAARKTLAAKLRTRGVVLSAALAGAAVVSPQLATAAVAAGTGAVLTSVVTSLADGASAMTLLNKLKLTGVAVLFLLLSAGGIGPWGANETSAAPVPKEKAAGELIWTHNPQTGELTAYTPDGEATKTLTLKDGEHFRGLTPDGQQIAFAGKKGKLPVPGAADGLTLHLRPVSDATEGTDTGLSLSPGDNVHWSPDGTQVVRVRTGPMDKAGGLTYEHVQFDLATRKETKVELPVNHYVVGWAANGKSWLLHEYVRADLRDPKLPRYRMMSVPVGGGMAPVPLCDGASLTRFEPAADGKSFHAVGHAHANPADDTDATYRRWFLVSDTGQATLLKSFAEFADIDLCPSPDRTRIVLLGRTNPDDTADVVLHLYDPDGSNEKKLAILTKGGQHTRLLGWFPRQVKAPPKAKREDGLIWMYGMNRGILTAHTPDGTEVKKVVLPAGVPFLGLTPGGAKWMFPGKKGIAAEKGDTDRLTLHIGPIDDSGTGTDTGLEFKFTDQLVLSPDGKQAVRVRNDKPSTGHGRPGTEPGHSHVLIDLATKTETKLDLPSDHRLTHWSADGKTWLVWHHNYSEDQTLPVDRWLTTPAGGEIDLKPVCDTHSFDRLDPHPDGKRYLGVGYKHTAKKMPEYHALFAVADGKAVEVAKIEWAGTYTQVRWSPDGKRIARLKFWPVKDDGKVKRVVQESVLSVLSADGKTEEKLLNWPADNPSQLLGWFPTPADPKAK